MPALGSAAPAPSAEVSSAPSELEQSVGQMFGDFTSDGGETPEPESTSAAGTTPAEPAAGTETETATPDAAAGDGTTTAASDGTTPDTPPATEPAETDPFADTTPATFMVNGKPHTSEDIRVFKEGGAVIRPEALPNVLNRLSERESLFERNRAQSVEYQTLAKATEWTDQESGKTYTGPEAAIELRVSAASLFAENQLLVETLSDPIKLAGILALEDVPDGKGGMTQRVVLDPTALEHLKTKNELAQNKISAEIRKHFAGVLAEASKGAPPAIDFTAEAPRLIAEIAKASNLDAALLTASDRKILTEALPDQAKGGKASVVWQGWVKERLQDRAAAKAQQSAVVDSTAKATKEAQARMAAAARGVKPITRAPVVAPKAKVPTPQEERAVDEGQLFDAMLSSGAKAMRSAR